MKPSQILIGLIIFCCADCDRASAQFQLVATNADWGLVTRRAANAHQSILVDFYTTWCGPCKLMDRTVFSQDSVITYLNEHFVNVKIDADTPFGRQMKTKFRVEAYPTYLYLDNELHPIRKLVGSKNAAGFLDESALALASYALGKPLVYYTKSYAAGQRDTTFVRLYLRKLIDANLDSLTQPVLDEYMTTQPQQAIRAGYNLDLLATYVRSCENPYFQTILAAKVGRITDASLRLKIQQSYRLSLKNCLDKAILHTDNDLFEKVMAIEQTDDGNLSKDLTAMQTKLKYYEQTKQDSLFDYWVNQYMSENLRTTNEDLTRKARKDFAHIYKNRKPDQDEDAFVARCVAGDWTTISINLNQYAWVYYARPGTPVQLHDALTWSVRACELVPVAQHFDTYAHLLYKMGRKDDALIQQQKAIEAAKKSQEETAELINELNKMRAGKL